VLILLRAAAAPPGLKLTSTGNLSRSVVAEMRDILVWPEFDNVNVFQFHNVINEPDFFPLFFIRHLAETGKLVRRQKGHLKVAPVGVGRRMLEEPDQRALQAVLFHIALWHINLGHFSRGLHDGWPQDHIGIALWSLSIAANVWETRERLTRMCTIPINDILETKWDMASWAMEAKILRPLFWFGLLEHRQDDIPESRFEKQHFYRMTPLYDRFLSFDVKLETTGSPHH
jgi:hypothetical protein